MAEAIVCLVLEQLVSGASGWLQEEISLLKGVKSKLDNMESKMIDIQMVLEDAESQSGKKENVKRWLKKFKDLSYDMDDVLDEWRTRVLILQREEAEENNTSDEIVGSSSSPTTCFSLKKLNCFSSVKQLPWRREIAKSIKDINERTDSVFFEMKDFELASKAVGNDDLNRIINQDDTRLTTALVDESKVYGRAKDKEFLLSKVLSMNTEQEESPQVISIVGAGGLGKTTLAQMVYNDEKVEQKFGGKRIWVCVSNPFDEVKVAKDILEGLKVDHTIMNNLQTVHQSLLESLSRRKFLLVLDDVWNEEFDKWERLSMCLKKGDPNSRILVTTRKEEVAGIMGTIPTNILKPRHISDLDCWFLMSQRAFQGRTKDNHELEVIGKEIAKKCKGLPLAAKTLGGMLRSKKSIDEWKEILNSEIWELEQVKVELFPHIFLSYQELPSLLKRCFLILAIFPKDTEFKVDDVIGIWMAHGFLNPRAKNDDMVKTGKKYLEFLVSRTLLEQKDNDVFQKLFKKKNTIISMHDIMHDFALHLLGDELISIDKTENGSSLESTSKGGSYINSTTVRHLYIDGNVDPTLIDFDVEKLYTCIIHNVTTNVTLDLVKSLKIVRALYLDHCDLKQVPPGIENLIHLRLLDLSGNPLIELPETIGDLANLLLIETPTLEKYPESLRKLINLHKLALVKVGVGKNKLGFLKDLNQLRGRLEISFCGEYGDEVDAKKAAIEGKQHITVLILNFNHQEVTDGVVTALHPPSYIQNLEIESLPRSWNLLPGWITSLHHLTELEVKWAPNVSTLPPLGELQSLKNLLIYHLDALKFIGREFLGIGNRLNKKCSPFPKLVELIISGCNELTGWEDLKLEGEDSINVMPNLQILEFLYCEKFVELPWRLLRQAPSLQSLTIRRLASLEVIGRNVLGIDDHRNIDHFVAFPSLLKLEIWNCGLLQWEDLKPEDEGKVTVMPKLQHLDIWRCKNLQVLPSRLLCGAASLEVYVNGERCSLHPSIKSENERGIGT